MLFRWSWNIFEDDTLLWNIRVFCFISSSLLKIEAGKFQKTKQLLRNHWDSNQTREFCNGQHEKNAIKYRV